MASHEPVLSLELEHIIDAVINNAFILRSIIGLDGIKCNNSSFSKSHDNFTIFPGFFKQNTTRNTGETDLLEGLK